MAGPATVTDAAAGTAVSGVPVIAYLQLPVIGDEQDGAEFEGPPPTPRATKYCPGLRPDASTGSASTRDDPGHPAATGYHSQCWDNVARDTPGASNDDPGAALVDVTAGHATGGIDARLAR